MNQPRPWSVTRLRLVASFLLPLAAFAAAAFLSMRNMERLVQSTDTIRGLQTGLKAALQMQNIAHEQDALQAGFALDENLANIEVLNATRGRMSKVRMNLAAVLETDEEREVLWAATRIENRLDRSFGSRLIPAVVGGDADAVRLLRRESSQAFAEIASLSERLVRSIQSRIDAAVTHAEEIRSIAVRDSGILLAAAVVLALGMALLTSRSVGAAIQRLIAGAWLVAQGRLDTRIDLPRKDEFGQLADAFNRMTAELRENQRRLVQARKMASLGQLAAGVAHEINNPIGVILGYTRVLAGDASLPARLREDVATIEDEARQCQRIVQELLDLARPVSSLDDDVDVGMLLRAAADRVQHFRPCVNIEAACDIPDAPPLKVRGDRDRLRQVFDNLARNAAEALPESGGRVTFRARLQKSLAPGAPDQVAIEVQDTGIGMNEDQVERIFDPFYSTKAGGSGLGLSIVYSMVQAHRGSIAVRSAPCEGATFTVLLPACAPPNG